MFVFTFVAGLFTFQYDKPHFDPLLRLPPNRARTHTDSPVMSRSSFGHVGDSITIFSVCVGCASRFHHRGKSLSCRTPRRVNPPNLPFYCGGVSPPRSPSLLTQQQQAVYKKGSPRRTRSRASQGCSHSSTTNRTSTRSYGRHRTGQLQRSCC